MLIVLSLSREIELMNIIETTDRIQIKQTVI